MRKYKIITDQTIKVEIGSLNYRYHYRLYRIQALRDFDGVRKGDLGGYIESEYNLSQSGDCWIYDDSKVFGYAKVQDNAKIWENSMIYDNASILGNVEIHGKVKVHGNAIIYDNVKMFENAEIYGNSNIYGNSVIYGNAKIYGDCKIHENAEIFDNVEIFGSPVIHHHPKIHGSSIIFDKAEICGHSDICGNAKIGGNAKIIKSSDYIVFMRWWVSNDNDKFLTWTKSNNMWKSNNFYGTGEDLLEEAYLEGGERNKIEYKRIIDYVNSIQQNDDYIRREKLIKYVDNILKGYEQKI